MTREAPPPQADDGAAVSDGAFRLYSLLLRYGNSTGCRMPSRPTLARRLRRSVDAVDRSMRRHRPRRAPPHWRAVPVQRVPRAHHRAGTPADHRWG
jgi:hypothetical protein